jgi:hypothetical protein
VITEKLLDVTSRWRTQAVRRTGGCRSDGNGNPGKRIESRVAGTLAL